MKTEGEGTGTNATNTTADLHKSCDRCGLKKRRCGGGHPCRRCSRLGGTCTYSKRRPRPQPPGVVSVGSASDGNIKMQSSLQARHAVSAALQHYGKVSLKRCRLSPSPATGLVGMQENIFLSDYFGCVGFLPFTSQSNIRETLVKMFAGPVSVQHSDSGDYSTTEQHFDTVIAGDGELPVDPSTCVFWCAVALGSLVKGRPIKSVEKYSRLAREALANVCGPPNAEGARAWAILAYMHDFCGDHDNFHAFLQRSKDILCDLQEEGHVTLPVGLSDVVKHGETIKLFIGDIEREEVESFCNQERAIPQISEAATEGEICQFVMQSYRSFEQAIYENTFERLLTTEPSTDIAWGKPAIADLLRGSSPHFIASVMPEPGEGSRTSGILGMMTTLLRTHSRQFQRLEHAADRSSIRGGVGGLIINGTLVFEKIAGKDIEGALEKLENCSDVLQQYPGLCRFTMGSHITHMLMANLTAIDDPRARVLYDKLSEAYNSARRPGTRPIPPFEEWKGVSSCCDNYYCRLHELMVMMEYEVTSCPLPPQECVAETREMGLNDTLVDDRQQPGGETATSSRDGGEGNSVPVSRPRHKSIDASGPNREPALVSDEESVGWGESMSSSGRQTLLIQPPDPTLCSSLFRKGASEPVVDSEVDRIVAEQSYPSSFTEFGDQTVDALLPSKSSKSRTMMIDGIEDESVGVEDWLDVTHAMLDASAPGLDW